MIDPALDGVSGSRPFALFGASHLLALIIIAAVAAGLVWFARTDLGSRTHRRIELALSCSLLAATGLFVAIELTLGTTTVATFLPFHLCDFAIFVAAFSLLRRSRLGAEVLYFWAFAGTSLAIVTPDLSLDVPSREYWFYFGLHGGVVIAAAYLTLGIGLAPRPGAPIRVWLLTNAYAGIVLAVNLAADTNYLYLLEPPSQPTLLDWFGPWPIYVLVAEAIALALFTLLYLPFYRRRPSG